MNPEWDITKYEITRFLISKYGNNWRNVLLACRTHITTYDFLRRNNLIFEFQKYQKNLEDGTEIVRKNIAHIIKKHSMGMNARINYRVLGLDKDYVYAVIGEMMGRQVHPTEDRIMNIREFMSLMGLPNDYELEGQKEFVKITQNVPVAPSENITTEIIAIINNQRELYYKSVFMQDNMQELIINKSKSLF